MFKNGKWKIYGYKIFSFDLYSKKEALKYHNSQPFWQSLKKFNFTLGQLDLD